MEKKVMVSTVIPTLNRASSIDNLVRNLVSDPYPNKEIIVVDGGSKDGTKDIAREAGAIVIDEEGEKKSPANARNQGVKVSKGEVINFMDGDNNVGSLFLSSIIKHFNDPNVVAAISKLEEQQNNLMQKVYRTTRYSSLTCFGRKILLEKGSPFNFMRKDLLNEFGGWPMIGVHDDTILSNKLYVYLKEHPEKKVVYEPNSVLRKWLPSSVEELFNESIFYGRTMMPYLTLSTMPLINKAIILTIFPVYLISMLSILLLPLSFWFIIPAIPYTIKLFAIVYETIKIRNKYRILIPIIDFIVSAGHTVGLLKYFLRRGGRIR